MLVVFVYWVLRWVLQWSRLGCNKGPSAMNLHWRGCAFSERQDGTCTAVFKFEQGTFTVKMQPHVFQDLAFEVVRTKAGKTEQEKVFEKMRRAKQRPRVVLEQTA